jgi:hypothetical protein
MQPKLKAPGTKRLKPKCDKPLSTFAFKFNLHHYIKAGRVSDAIGVLREAMSGAGTRTYRPPHHSTHLEPRFCALRLHSILNSQA